MNGIPSHRVVANIVNFVRGCEPRADIDLLLPVVREIELNRKYGFPNTLLFQYDALLRPDIMAAVAPERENPKTEFGVWLEMARPLVEAVGIPWRGRPGWDWDWHVNPGFLMAYTHDERRRICDEVFRLFHKTFGAYPKSVGSWLLDCVSIEHMHSTYGVDAFCICREQDNVDAYTLWGGYFNGAYYPSRRNMLSPAVEMANAIPAPVFRMLTPDPIYNARRIEIPEGYEGGVASIEPVYESGRDPRVIDWYFRTYARNPSLSLSYLQLGQENSFGWDRIGPGLSRQLEQLAIWAKRGEIIVETLGETGRRFQADHPNGNVPQALVAVEDWGDAGNQAAWYASRRYRAGLLRDGADGTVELRSLHVFSDAYEERYLRGVCEGKTARYYTLPAADRWLLGDATTPHSGSLVLDGRFAPFTSREDGGALVIETRNLANGAAAWIRFAEDRMEFGGCALRFVPPATDGIAAESDLEGVRDRLSSDTPRHGWRIDGDLLRMTWGDFPYALGAEGGIEGTPDGGYLIGAAAKRGAIRPVPPS